VAIEINPPITGYWNRRDFPDVVRITGAVFRKAVMRQSYDGVVEQYREDVAKNSRHLKVLKNGTWVIDHVDLDNPDRGRPVQHFFNDHPLGPLAALVLLVGGVYVARAVARG
jgi:hypothetical protein